MTNNPILKRQPNEDFDDYHIRLFENMKSYGIDKFIIRDLLNEESGNVCDESKWRKDYAQSVKWINYYISKNITDDEYLKELDAKILELKMQTIKFRDQKRENENYIRSNARFENLKETMLEAVEELKLSKPLEIKEYTVFGGSKDGLLLLSDWHFGMITDNRWNKFNSNIFDTRIEKLLIEVVSKSKQNGVSNLHVGMLGDVIHGIIHTSARVSSESDVITQITKVSEKISEMLIYLCGKFETVTYYNVAGNHGRVIANKHDSINQENFELLIPTFLKGRLSHLDNLEIIQEEDGLCVAEIKGKKCLLTHGHFDNPNSASSRLSQAFGWIPDYLFHAHFHHISTKEVGATTTVFGNGCLSGADGHSVGLRLINKPSQSYYVFDEEGIDAHFPIKL